MAGDDRWNHNIHYHAAILDALPSDCGHVLDVGCGEGMLARELSRHAHRVTALDRDEPTIEQARAHAAAGNVEYLVGDFLTDDFAPEAFDAVVSVATIHHMGTAVALTRMRELVRPGGTIAVVGLAGSWHPADLVYDAAGSIVTRVHRRTKTYWETSAPKVWPPPESFAQVRRAATEVLPGVRNRRHVMWRYTLVWTKPDG